MTDKDLVELTQWFSGYAGSFYSSDDEDQKNIMLKVEHTEHVRENIKQIAGSLSLQANEMMLAETIALFHDVGRYSQYARYKTFRDADSVNHGYLGAEVLKEEKVLNVLPADEAELIITCVKFHGAFAIPDTADKQTRFFLKLIRDADKLDIYRVFIEYYESTEENKASATAFGVPDSPEYSRDMLGCLFRKKIASYAHIKSQNDFRIMKLSWVYDLNFRTTLDLLVKRNYLDRIISKLPQTDEIHSAVAYLKKYIEHEQGCIN